MFDKGLVCIGIKVVGISDIPNKQRKLTNMKSSQSFLTIVSDSHLEYTDQYSIDCVAMSHLE